MYRKKRKGMARKGQFFIISAIIIIVAIYGLNEVLNQDWKMDVTAAQGKDPGRLIKNIERAFLVIIGSSSNLSTDLGELEAAIGKLGEKKGFYVRATSNSTDSQNATLSIVLDSAGVHMEKVFTADVECMKTSPYFSNPQACTDLGTSKIAECCSDYGRCCEYT